MLGWDYSLSLSTRATVYVSPQVRTGLTVRTPVSLGQQRIEVPLCMIHIGAGGYENTVKYIGHSYCGLSGFPLTTYLRYQFSMYDRCWLDFNCSHDAATNSPSKIIGQTWRSQVAPHFIGFRAHVKSYASFRYAAIALVTQNVSRMPDYSGSANTS